MRIRSHLNLEAEVVPLTRISLQPPGWDTMLKARRLS